MSYWHRADALEDMKRQPLVYGGIADVSASQRNAACQSCHQEIVTDVKTLKHQTVSCESCHGALFDHVRDGRKIAAAVIDQSRWQCLNCHDERINRPKNFPQFSRTGKIGKKVKEHTKLDKQTPCQECHDAHDPTP